MIKHLICLISIIVNSLLLASDLENKFCLLESSKTISLTDYDIKTPAQSNDKVKALTAIEKAMQANDYKALSFLLNSYSFDKSELGELFFWASCDKQETRLLIKAGADVNYAKRYKGCRGCLWYGCMHARSPLLYKLYKGSIEEASTLVMAGASLYSRDQCGRSPVHMAVLLTHVRDNIEPIYKFLCQAQMCNQNMRILLDLKDKKARCAMDMLYEDEKLVFEGHGRWPMLDETIKQEFVSIRNLILMIKSNPIFQIS